ncbi:MAG: tRNA (adenosine(37)-N6)-threonylcarbamoyltransferase complex transferase subunit TsaD [Alphaproteobacteria bacterium]|nr:MAG: tRNA (adenosine(37)-N6)-threonylcarbamoyltransferase complex transferase subunit TsaD [Alphaproteobacteria bacterium]
MVLYLGIETSCDDTSVALMDDEVCLGYVTDTQDSSTFGGVVPEYASREHMNVLPDLIDSLLLKHNKTLFELGFIAATIGPGLLGSLMVGVTYAKSLAWSLNIPWIGVHHLEAHAMVSMWQNNFSFPFGILLVSGGHTCIIIAKELGKYEIIGSSLDDAVGEMFDKVGRKLGFDNPSGPFIEECAKNGNKVVKLPTPLYLDKSTNFSFSGLKTAAIRYWEQSDKTQQDKANLCASLQDVVTLSLCDRLQNAFGVSDLDNWCFVGGVASNLYIRNRISALCKSNGKSLFIPDPHLCRDNGVMIAYTGYKYYLLGQFSSYSDSANSALKF